MEDITIIEGDAIEAVEGLEDGSIDAIVTDPPYCAGAISEARRTRGSGQGLRSETLRRFGWFTGDNMGTAGLAWILRSLAVQATRVVKNTGSMIVFCDWRMLAALQPAIESAGLRYQGLIVWDKGSMGLGNGFRCQHELAMHFTFGSPEYHAADVPNVITVRRPSKVDRLHQAEKPLELMVDLVRVVSPPGGRVLDPFAGSGSTVEACIKSGRGCVAVERDPEHVATIRRRVAEARTPLLDLCGKPEPAPTLFDASA